ncbi:hypothetical protein CPB84DRAFT_1848132 [Gymnopilus junonius]|uniref:Uncharacterized protein n=1 Tax=Gymnopilus junonius TaxID=109634 RepID=A0A9P5NKV1_GYMJU|nr:hypothetical protein CPB84DRAFT_1848132 [Gymnopilus junonius]
MGNSTAIAIIIYPPIVFVKAGTRSDKTDYFGNSSACTAPVIRLQPSMPTSKAFQTHLHRSLRHHPVAPWMSRFGMDGVGRKYLKSKDEVWFVSSAYASVPQRPRSPKLVCASLVVTASRGAASSRKRWPFFSDHSYRPKVLPREELCSNSD